MSALLHPQTINGAINHGFGNLQQMPNGKHHGSIRPLEVIATLIRGD
jgi:hypothetical protein